MNDKFELYDILAVLIPGGIVLDLVSVTFPTVVTHFGAVTFPPAFAVICLVAVAAFLGHLIQAITSLVEPFIYWTWGGRPSERALNEGLGARYFPADAATRIRAKLAGVVGKDASDPLYFFTRCKKRKLAATRASRNLTASMRITGR